MKHILAAFFLLGSYISFGQNPAFNWSVQPFSDLGFAENIGRYDHVMDEEVEYFAEYAGHKVFFSNNAFIFGKPEELTEEEAFEVHEKMEHGEEIKPVNWNYFKIEFSGANPNTSIEHSQIKHHTIHFQNPQNPLETMKARAFGQLTYKNIYPNIDMVVELPKSGGLKYAFHVHPGGDYKAIEMKYVGITPSRNEAGNLNLVNAFSSFSDAAPTALAGDQEVEVEFICQDNVVTFNTASYDLSNELIIDPWIETTLPFLENNDGYEVGYDVFGNCAILGGKSDDIALYNNVGVLQWVWDEGVDNSFLGDLTTNPANGDIYYFRSLSSSIHRFDLTGSLIDLHFQDWSVDVQEMHRLAYNTVYNELWLGGGNPIDAPDIERMGFNLSGGISFDIFTMADYGFTICDVVLLDLDPDGDFIYFLSVTTTPTTINNKLNKVSRMAPLTVIWSVPTGHTFTEIFNVPYYESGYMSGHGNGFNGIASGTDFVCTYDGNLLKKYDKTTGLALDSTFLGLPEYTHAGIDIGDCDFIYVGTNDSVLVFDSDLEKLGGFATVDRTYDLLVNGSVLYVSGEGFVAEIDVTDFAFADYELESTPTLCEGCNGSASVVLPPPSECATLTLIDVVWSPGGESTMEITDLCEGWYVATTTWIDSDGEEVVYIDSVEVTESDMDITYDMEMTNVSCFGLCDGSVTIVPTSGLAPYTFTLGLETNTTGIFTDICPGSYDLSVTDANGCSGLDALLVFPEPEVLAAAIIDQTNVSCFGGSDGTVTVEGIDGTGPYQFDIGDGLVDSGEFTGLPAGEYTVTVQDSMGCTVDVAVEILEPTELILTAVSSVNILCNGGDNGMIEVMGSGGTAPYEYSIDDVLFGASPLFESLVANNYTVTVRDANGCETTLDFILTEPDAIVTTSVITDEICEGDCNGVINLDASGGVAPYTYSIDACVTLEPTGTFVDLCPADYTICVEDANGCHDVNDLTINAGIPPADATINPLGPLCVNDDPVEITVAELGTLTGDGVVGGIFDPNLAGAGTHTITNTIVDVCGGAVATIDVLVHPVPTVNFTVNKNDGCIPLDLVFMNTGDTGINCDWTFGDGTTASTCGDVAHIYSESGVYDVSLTVEDANGCTATAIYYGYIEAHPLPIANFSFVPETVTTIDRMVEFTDLSIGADSWIWSFDAFGLSNDQNPIYVFPDEEREYDITQIAISPHDCKDTITKTIIVHQEHLIFVPNIITPDGDPYNQVFLPYFTGIDIYNYHLVIYNRWGETIFESYDLSKGWNGTYGDGGVVQDGVYIWHITASDKETDKIREYQGHVTVTK